MAKLYKRGKVWYAKIKINGQRVRKALARDYRIAEDKLADLVKQRESVQYDHAPRDLSWQAFRTEYIHERKVEKAENTWTSDERAFRELESTYPLNRIRQMTPGLLDRVRAKWIATRTYKNRQPKKYVINRDLRSIKTAMRWAERQKYLPKQDWTTVQYIKTPKGRVHFFTQYELQRLKKVCRGVWLTILYLGARAGLRPAEMFWLEWTDIEFENNRIHIGPKETWVPKDYETRFIPMTVDLRAYLEAVHPTRTDNRVLSDHGHVPTLNSITVYFKKLCKKVGLKGTPYTLRHTYGSHYTQNGGNIYRLKEYMGHSDIETTMIYIHTAKGDEDRALAAMPAF
jgi:integrase